LVGTYKTPSGPQSCAACVAVILGSITIAVAKIVPEDCYCPPSMYRVGGRGAVLPKCVDCTVGFYCQGLPPDIDPDTQLLQLWDGKTLCPPGSTTVGPRSVEQASCLCSPGYFLTETFTCVQCPVGRFKSYIDNSRNCTGQCVGNATSAKGAVNAEACRCESGHVDPNPEDDILVCAESIEPPEASGSQVFVVPAVEIVMVLEGLAPGDIEDLDAFAMTLTSRLAFIMGLRDFEYSACDVSLVNNLLSVHCLDVFAEIDMSEDQSAIAAPARRLLAHAPHAASPVFSATTGTRHKQLQLQHRSFSVLQRGPNVGGASWPVHRTTRMSGCEVHSWHPALDLLTVKCADFPFEMSLRGNMSEGAVKRKLGAAAGLRMKFTSQSTSVEAATMAASNFKPQEFQFDLIENGGASFSNLQGMTLEGTTTTTVSASCPNLKALPGGASYVSIQESCKCQAGYEPKLKNAPLSAPDCIMCPLGKWKARAADTPCLQCDRDRDTLINGVNTSGLCYCKEGFTAAPGSACTDCPIGQFCPFDFTDSPASCKKGSRTVYMGARSQNDCQCVEGWGRSTKNDPCDRCVSGKFKGRVGDEVCENCPQENLMSTPWGSISEANCSCNVGYYYARSTQGNRCVRCTMAGLQCDGGFLEDNSSHKMPYALGGFFLSSLNYVESCRISDDGTEFCQGGVEPNNGGTSLHSWKPCTGNCSCHDGHDGFMCQNCQLGYSRDIYTEACQRCDELPDTWALIARLSLSAIGQSSVFHGLSFMAVKSAQGSKGLHSPLLRLWQSWVLSMTPLKIYDVGDVKMFSWGIRGARFEEKQVDEESVRFQYPKWFYKWCGLLYSLSSFMPNIGSPVENAECLAERFFDDNPAKAGVWKHYFHAGWWCIYPVFVLLWSFILDLILVYGIFPILDMLNFFPPSGKEDYKRWAFNKTRPRLLESLQRLGVLNINETVQLFEEIVSSADLDYKDLQILYAYPITGLETVFLKMDGGATELLTKLILLLIRPSIEGSLHRHCPAASPEVEQALKQGDLPGVWFVLESVLLHLDVNNLVKVTSDEDEVIERLHVIDQAGAAKVRDALARSPLLKAAHAPILRVLTQGPVSLQETAKHIEVLHNQNVEADFVLAKMSSQAQEDFAQDAWASFVMAASAYSPDDLAELLSQGEKHCLNTLAQGHALLMLMLCRPMILRFLASARTGTELTVLWSNLLELFVGFQHEHNAAPHQVSSKMACCVRLLQGFREGFQLCERDENQKSQLPEDEDIAMKAVLETIYELGETVNQPGGQLVFLMHKRQILTYLSNDLLMSQESVDKNWQLVIDSAKMKQTRVRYLISSFQTKIGMETALSDLLVQEEPSMVILGSEPQGDEEKVHNMASFGADMLNVWKHKRVGKKMPDYIIFGLFRARPSVMEFFVDSAPIVLISLYTMWYEATKRLLLFLHCDVYTVGNEPEARWMKHTEWICGQGEHWLVQNMAIGGLVAWMLLPLLIIARGIRSNLSQITTPEVQRVYAYFINGYNIDNLFWDVLVKRLDLFCTILITYTNITTDTKSRILCYTLIAGSVLLLNVFRKPFDKRKNRLLDRIEVQGLCVRFGTYSMLEAALIFNPGILVSTILATGVLIINAGYILSIWANITVECVAEFGFKFLKADARGYKAALRKVKRDAGDGNFFVVRIEDLVRWVKAMFIKIARSHASMLGSSLCLIAIRVESTVQWTIKRRLVGKKLPGVNEWFRRVVMNLRVRFFQQNDTAQQDFMISVIAGFYSLVLNSREIHEHLRDMSVYDRFGGQANLRRMLISYLQKAAITQGLTAVGVHEVFVNTKEDDRNTQASVSAKYTTPERKVEFRMFELQVNEDLAISSPKTHDSRKTRNQQPLPPEWQVMRMLGEGSGECPGADKTLNLGELLNYFMILAMALKSANTYDNMPLASRASLKVEYTLRHLPAAATNDINHAMMVRMVNAMTVIVPPRTPVAENKETDEKILPLLTTEDLNDMIMVLQRIEVAQVVFLLEQADMALRQAKLGDLRRKEEPKISFKPCALPEDLPLLPERSCLWDEMDAAKQESVNAQELASEQRAIEAEARAAFLERRALLAEGENEVLKGIVADVKELASEQRAIEAEARAAFLERRALLAEGENEVLTGIVADVKGRMVLLSQSMQNLAVVSASSDQPPQPLSLLGPDTDPWAHPVGDDVIS